MPQCRTDGAKSFWILPSASCLLVLSSPSESPTDSTKCCESVSSSVVDIGRSVLWKRVVNKRCNLLCYKQSKVNTPKDLQCMVLPPLPLHQLSPPLISQHETKPKPHNKIGWRKKVFLASNHEPTSDQIFASWGSFGNLRNRRVLSYTVWWIEGRKDKIARWLPDHNSPSKRSSQSSISKQHYDKLPECLPGEE